MSWKKPTSKHGMNVVTCDYGSFFSYAVKCGCDDFRSASIVGVLADQLRAAHWGIYTKPTTIDPKYLTLRDLVPVKSIAGVQERVFLCPARAAMAANRVKMP